MDESFFATEEFAKACTFDPYIQCPTCGQQTCGINVIGYRHFSRLCYKCRSHFDGGKLPELDKQIIYLDQCALGWMVRSLGYKSDPSTEKDPLQIPTHEKFLKAFGRLDVLNKKQLLVCPSSEFHFTETIVMPEPYAESLRKVNTLLSSTHHFQYASRKIVEYVIPHFQDWLEGKTRAFDANKKKAVDGRVDEWHMRINVVVKHKITKAEVQGAHEEKEQNHAALQHLFQQWRSSGMTTFEQFRTAELSAVGELIISLRGGKFYEDLPPPTSMLQILLQAVMYNDDFRRFAGCFFGVREGGNPSVEDREQKIREYFASGVALQVPFLSLASGFAAHLAQRVGQNPAMKAKTSDIIDILFMSLLLPYSDAVLMEGKWQRALEVEPLKSALSYKAKTYSVDNMEEFFEYLDRVEAAAPQHVREKVKEVYGDPEPFYSVCDFG
jgi:hypothetical protein